jgi:uncharacterized protein (TIGR02246 family)
MSPKTQGTEARRRAARAAGAETEILNLIETVIGGWNHHDLKVFASPFGEEADFVTVAGRWWRGREEIADRHAEAHRTRFGRSRVKAQRTSIRFIRPDVAVVHLEWEMSGDLGPDGRGIPLRRGLITFLASEDYGRWQFDAAQNTDLMTD